MSVEVAVARLDFSSIESVGTDYRALDLDPEAVGPSVASALGLSETRAYRLMRGIFESAPDQGQAIEEATHLVAWAGDTGSTERQLVARALRNSDAALLLVHLMSGMSRADARAFMRAYLDSGGSLDPVLDWLVMAGATVERPTFRADGGGTIFEDIGTWVGNAIEDLGDAVADGAAALIDAVTNNGISLLEALAGITSWSIEEVTTLLRGLLDLAKIGVEAILEAALEVGSTVFRKVVRAIWIIRERLDDLFDWALRAGVAVLETVIDVLVDRLVSSTRLLTWLGSASRRLGDAVVAAVLDLGHDIERLLRIAVGLAGTVLERLVAAFLATERTLRALLAAIADSWRRVVTRVIAVLRELGSDFIDILEAAGKVSLGLLQLVATVLIASGTEALDLLRWAVTQVDDFLIAVLSGVRDGGIAFASLIVDIAESAVDLLGFVVEAMFALGYEFMEILEDLASVTGTALARFLEAAFRAGAGLVEFVGYTIAQSYRYAADLVGAAIDAGVTAAELLGEVAGESYWSFRRIVNGILAKLGTVGAVLDWVMTVAEGAVDEVWHDALLAIRFAGASLTEVLDWAASQTESVFEAIVRAWESIGEALLDLYRWASKAGAEIWAVIGHVTVAIENSVSYVLVYLEEDYLAGIERFVTGLLEAGFELAALVLRLVGIGLEAATVAVTALLEFGIDLSVLLVELVAHPAELQDHLLAAVTAAETALETVLAAAAEAGDSILEATTRTLHSIGESVSDMLDAALEIGGGALGVVVSALVSLLETFRPLTLPERRAAQDVFGTSIDLDRVGIATESPANSLIYEIQSWFSAQPRPFTTMTCINIDPNVGISTQTLIHELTHVWQGLETGPFYISEAIHALNTPENYNYGYHSTHQGGRRGDGGDDDLIAANDDFEAFNREQQASIIEHYYVRRYVDTLPETGPVGAQTWGAWKPYADVVRA